MASASNQPPGPNPPPNPPLDSDVAQYLQFLQKIDLQRIGLVSSLDQAIAAASNPATPQPAASQNSFSQSAQQLMADYLAPKAPTDCSDVSNNYFRLIQDQTQMIAKAGASLNSGDSRGAASAHDSVASQIAADAQNADNALGQLCIAQRINKPFAIVADPTASSPGAAPGTTPAAPAPSPTQTLPPAQPTMSTPAPAQPATPSQPDQTNSGPAPVSG
jgi:hypothetical protein